LSSNWCYLYEITLLFLTYTSNLFFSLSLSLSLFSLLVFSEHYSINE
jgi:hypothetical protein